MKRFFTFLVTSALIAAFCIAGFAESINSARAVACPGCDRGGLVTVKCGERSEVKYERCSHGKICADKYELIYYVYCLRCSNNCGYSEPSYERLVNRKLIECGGI